MFHRIAAVTLVAAAVVCSATQAQAQFGWMTGKDSSTKSSSKSSSDSSWLPWSKKPVAAKPKAKKPSTMGKMAQSTKNAWDKTVDFVNPFDNDTPKKPAPKSQSSSSYFGGGSSSSSTAQSESKKSTGWFSSWGKPKEEEPKPLDMREWLGQDRPQ